jgi:hypothetical protein
LIEYLWVKSIVILTCGPRAKANIDYDIKFTIPSYFDEKNNNTEAKTNELKFETNVFYRINCVLFTYNISTNQIIHESSNYYSEPV